MTQLRYPSTASAFSERAMALLTSDDPASLFYAALEVRMGVEARLQSYVQASRHTSSALKKGWKIQHLAKGLEKAFKGQKDVVELSYALSSSELPFAILHYTPVTSPLQKLAQRLGDYLHHREVTRDDSWWGQFRSIVQSSQALLSAASAGQLLGPPLWDPKTGQVHLNLEFNAGDPAIEQMQQFAKTRQQMVVNVTYHPADQFYAALRANNSFKPNPD